MLHWRDFNRLRLEAPGGSVNLNRRTFTKSVAGALGSLVPTSWGGLSAAARANTPVPLQRAEARLSPAKVTKIRVFYPPNYNANAPQAIPQSNMVVLVDTETGITGSGQGGSPDTVCNVARSAVGKDAGDTEMF